ncbi:RING finger protein 145 [Frankliniella fusca]|uniref:RING finger protein 145 n=1 Tax=Frankliniella fusca TaxID=407009 RepID=A0AAE1HKJ5_9NEOP|nr:RING finger protein 145 [Frankliniella fusca]
MGMIARVRARLQSIHTVTNKPDPARLQDDTYQSVCLVTVVLLLLPYLSRGPVSIMLALAYSCLVLPVLMQVQHQSADDLRDYVCTLLAPSARFLRRMYGPLQRMETVLIGMNNLFTMLNQCLFFMVCERALVPGQRVACLYSLMFYNVAAYCASYVRELIAKEDWSLTVPVADHSRVKHLAMTATRLVLEWTKAVTFIITVVFMLLVFGLERGLEHYHPNGAYTALTWLYYMATEKVFADLFPALLTLLRLERLESLEALWAPVLQRAFCMALAVTLSLPLLLRAQYRVAVSALYCCGWVRWRELSQGPLRALQAERAVLERYRHASAEELAAHDDDVCAVCLAPMRSARVTPCHHLFHADCLRRCLSASDICPICKRTFHFD